MSVYVDDKRARYGRLVMCHMTADTLAELHGMADRVGVARRWFQTPPNCSFPHYDICLEKRAAAIVLGAVEISARASVYYAAKLGVEWARAIPDPLRSAFVEAGFRKSMERARRAVATESAGAGEARASARPEARASSDAQRAEELDEQ